MFDIIIIGAGASGLFLWTQLSKDKKVLILEKNSMPGNKLLLTWKWRCNFTNLNVNSSNYFWDSLDRLDWYFREFWPQDMISFLNQNEIETKEEDHWRMFLKSNKSKQLLDFFLKKNEENEHTLILWETVLWIEKDDGYIIRTDKGLYKAKNIIISTWGKSFPQVWGSDYIFQFSKEFWIVVEDPIPVLSWIITSEDLSNLSWSSVNANLQVKNKQGNLLYQEDGVILFTHWWISGPAAFNASLFMKESPTVVKYKTKLRVSSKEITKRLISFLWFRVNKLEEYIISSDIINVRWLDEAKVCWWGVWTKNLNDDFECREIQWLYFIWECLDVTWKTWWYNLQWCRTSWAVCANGINGK